jgi:hypothetical protein
MKYEAAAAVKAAATFTGNAASIASEFLSRNSCCHRYKE